MASAKIVLSGFKQVKRDFPFRLIPFCVFTRELHDVLFSFKRHAVPVRQISNRFLKCIVCDDSATYVLCPEVFYFQQCRFVYGFQLSFRCVLSFSHIVVICLVIKVQRQVLLKFFKECLCYLWFHFSLENSINVSPIIQLKTSFSQAKKLSSLYASPISDHDYFKHFFFFMVCPRTSEKQDSWTCIPFLVLYVSYVVL